VFDGIGFNMPQSYDKDLEGKKIDVVFNIDENNFRGIKSIQLKIKDIKLN